MIRIAEPNPADKAALQELFLRVRQSAFPWMVTAAFHTFDFDEETKGESILVIHFNNAVAGFISIWEPDHFIHHLYIANEYQKKGLGTMLLHAFLDKATSPVGLKCLEKNKEAIAFYKKNGFMEKGTGVEGNEPYVLMEYNKSFI